jgi:hypothetical protein
MNSKAKLAIICAMLVSVAGVLWIAGPLQLVLKATPFLLLLGVWVFLVIRKYPNGPGQRIPWLGSSRH